MSAFELALLGGPWGRRLGPRRRWIDALPWGEAFSGDVEGARALWTQTAFSEYASAAAFAEIASALLAAGAPIDLIAAAADFVVDEIVHTEVSARIAGALGGAVALDVDLTRLVRPPAAEGTLLCAAELVVRTSCVGEAMTVPILKLTRAVAGSELVAAALARVLADESSHAQLGGWFLDWAEPRLDDDARAHLGRVAGSALRSFAPLLGPRRALRAPWREAQGGSRRASRDTHLGGSCSTAGLGGLGCDRYDPAFADAAVRRVAQPLAARGIEVPPADLEAVGAFTTDRSTGHGRPLT